MDYPAFLEDEEFEATTLDRVERQGDSWVLHHGGLVFGYSASEAPDFEPRVGDEARFYGRGLGYVVRGLAIRGQVIFYRTADEQRVEQDLQVAEYKAKRAREFEESGRTKLDADYAALPPIFQARIDKFRENNLEFRVEFEDYEMFCCTEAVKLAKHLGTVEAAEHYARLADSAIFSTDRARWDREWEEQKAIDRAAGLADGHSGNTHGMAVALAFWYLKHPENVQAMHGALAPLVGSEEYGCVAKSSDA